MTSRPHSVRHYGGVALAAFLVTVLASCASTLVPNMRRDGSRTAPQDSVPADGTASGTGTVHTAKLGDDLGPQPVIRRGSGQVINRAAATAPPPSHGVSSGEASFNFEGESLHAVVKAILGDMLGQNYTIAPGVQGTVTLNTQKAVGAAGAMTLLEQVLAQNNARMVFTGGRYNIIPATAEARAGSVAPRAGSAANARGYEVRVVPLRYVSATEMEKILKPYARNDAIVNVDNSRNVISIGGTRNELENYLRTIEIFDVDWLSGMSVGVFPIQSGKASKVVADLEKVFGETSKSPVAGMFRFMPLDGANAVLVITSQPNYLDDIQQWLERIDNAGGEVQLFSYELKYIEAKDLAQQLTLVFGGRGAGGGDSGGGAPSLMPGTDPVEISDTGSDSSTSTAGGKDGSSGSGGMGSGMSLGGSKGGNTSVTLEVEGSKVGVAAVEETNSLLVRATPGAWRSIRDVVEKLDVMPMQVHIEAQVVEVTLSGALEYGVSWFLENAAIQNGLPNWTAPNGSGLVPKKWSTLGASIGGTSGPGLAWTLLKNDAAAVITALDAITDLQLLQTPSVMTRNNKEATLNVGTKIPIESVSFNPGGVSNPNGGTFSQVQYLDTGVILKVRPRVSKDGVVFLDIVQEVSSPGQRPANCTVNCNVAINTRRLKTQAAVQSGDTVMLAGLISDGVERGSSGLPGLSRIPVIGGLFGKQRSNTTRNETIVLITPTIVRNAKEARDLTDEYGRRFRALEPLNRAPRK